MCIGDFYFLDMNVKKSCGQLFCNGSHDVANLCPSLEGVKNAPPQFSIEGKIIITDPPGMSHIPVPFRSRKMAEVFIHKDLLDKGPNAGEATVNSFELMQAAENIIEEYKKADVQWDFVAWYKPAFKGNEQIFEICVFNRLEF